MIKISRIFLGVAIAVMGVVTLSPLVNADDTTKTFTIKTNNIIEGDSMTSGGVTYLLQKIEDETITTISEKTSNKNEEISFNPLTFPSDDNSSHFYRIIQKDDVAGLATDKKIVYVRIVPKTDLLAYQDDTTYKYVNDGSGPHPYHATDEELQGQASAVYDS